MRVTRERRQQLREDMPVHHCDFTRTFVDLNINRPLEVSLIPLTKTAYSLNNIL